MELIICKNYEEISVKGAEIIAGQIKVKPNSVLGLATGNSPIGIYDRLCMMHRVGALDFSRKIRQNNKRLLGDSARSRPSSFYHSPIFP